MKTSDYLRRQTLWPILGAPGDPTGLGSREKRSVPSEIVAGLKAFHMGIKPGTDRDYELRQIFKQLKGGIKPD
ncbi:MAG: hypothetical protein ABJC13_26005 [Acidobacteriota bacterium]